MSPMNSWKSMGPLVVSALKLGAMLPRRRLDPAETHVSDHYSFLGDSVGRKQLRASLKDDSLARDRSTWGRLDLRGGALFSHFEVWVSTVVVVRLILGRVAKQISPRQSKYDMTEVWYGLVLIWYGMM